MELSKALEEARGDLEWAALQSDRYAAVPIDVLHTIWKAAKAHHEGEQ